MKARPPSSVSPVKERPGMLSSRTAVCWVPARKYWPPLQRLRVFHDEDFIRWPPHIKLLHPFVEDSPDALQRAAASMQKALSAWRPFDTQLTAHGTSPGGKGGLTCGWLAPADAKQLANMRSDLAAAVPAAVPALSSATVPGSPAEPWRPRLHVGQWSSRSQAHGALQDLQESETFDDEVTAIYILTRSSHTAPFAVAHVLRLGESATVGASLSGTYIATIGQLPDARRVYATDATPNRAASQGGEGHLRSVGQHAAESARAELAEWQSNMQRPAVAKTASRGALQATAAYYFAFGANMNDAKLRARRMQPLQSVAAMLPGFESEVVCRLTFQHRGGFGTVMPLPPGRSAASGLHAVHGTAHLLTAEQLGQLTAMEHEYLPVDLLIVTYDGEELWATTYVTPPERLIREGLPPTQRYLQLLQDGSRAAGLHSAHVDWLSSLSGLSNSRDRDAQYTTLVLDGSNMEAWPKRRVGAASPRGKGQRGTGGGRGGGRGRGRGTGQQHSRRPPESRGAA